MKIEINIVRKHESLENSIGLEKGVTLSTEKMNRGRRFQNDRNLVCGGLAGIVCFQELAVCQTRKKKKVPEGTFS